jgi:hypothetical protein
MVTLLDYHEVGGSKILRIVGKKIFKKAELSNIDNSSLSATIFVSYTSLKRITL